MRVLARIGFTLAGLAVVAPSGARAGLPIVAGAPWSPAQQTQQQTQKTASKPGLLKGAKATSESQPERLCGDCQRSQLLAQQGVSVPPAPPLPPGTVVKANMCTRCGQPAAVLAGRRLPSPSRSLPPQMLADRAGVQPGRAVVGGEAPGYAVIGNEPAPIGMVQPRLAASGLPASGMMGPGAGTRDGSVMPTAAASSPSDPVMPMGHNRPHILSHLLGLSAIGHERAEARERREEETHAKIAYGSSGIAPVQNLPSSVVYGR